MFAQFDRLHAVLAQIAERQEKLLQGDERIHHVIHLLEQLMSSLESLKAQVAQSTSVMSAALALISGFHGQLQSAIDASKANDDHVALDALAADLAASSTALAAAVQANTVADPSVNVDKSADHMSSGAATVSTTETTGTDSADAGATATTETVDAGPAAASTDAPAASTDAGTPNVGENEAGSTAAGPTGG